MISEATLEQSIREAGDAVRGYLRELSVAQSSLSDAQRELRLLMGLAELRGLEVAQVRDLTEDSPIEPGLNGRSDGAGGRASSPTKTTLLGAVVEILEERGEAMQIRELMAAVQERGIAIPGSGQQANLIAHISRDERIARPRRGFYTLRERGTEHVTPKTRRRVRRSAAGAKA